MLPLKDGGSFDQFDATEGISNEIILSFSIVSNIICRNCSYEETSDIL